MIAARCACRLIVCQGKRVHWSLVKLQTRAHFKTFGNPTRKRGTSLELLRLQSLAHASGFRMSCKRGFEMRSLVICQMQV
jgi:hypothetical protein